MHDYEKITSKVTFIVNYQSSTNRIYSETFTVDLKAGVSMPYGIVETKGDELRTISYTLQEMLQKNL